MTEQTREVIVMYKYVYILKHARVVDYDEDDPIKDSKILGVYSSLIKAKNAINFFAELPGFIDYPNDYDIMKKRLYCDNAKNHENVFLIEHEKHLYDDVYEKSLLNLYNNEKDALEYIETQKNKHDFSQESEKYEIIEYSIDKHSEYWGEGFD